MKTGATVAGKSVNERRENEAATTTNELSSDHADEQATLGREHPAGPVLWIVPLAAGWLGIENAKTDAGVRKVKIKGALHDELAIVKADAKPGQRLAFPTLTDRQMSADNFRNRVLAVVVKRANANLAAEGKPPLPAKLTPHSLRRTFCSLLYALGEDPGTVMDEMGHTGPELALKVYRQAMRRDEDEKARLQALIEGRELAGSGRRIGRQAAQTTIASAERQAA